MFRRLALAFAALLSVVSAQLTITSPGPNDWWVASSLNTISWTCSTSPYQNFTILLANSNTAVLPAPLAIIAVQYNYDCSKTITQQQSAQPAGTGYTVQFASTLNSTDIYAQSEPFEIKALGSSYPTTTSTAGSTATGTASGSAGAAQATTTGGTLAQYVPVGMSMVAALALGLVVA
ncbi:hypothetical protein DEU56DRAFT_289970 [Suillus clintonianus]|uniref:uncharacterized protein n=1 Tax=Suillus clintonianus TaxID=1904413 RepID=UPI001B886D5E|nr:uncharacterized protein DEU56DRAFT_289970 [Suillus clintonianus]KAG2140691.1 hypothetical protein DEU56DRAFT_289970 [Suillus clintonianus]